MPVPFRLFIVMAPYSHVSLTTVSLKNNHFQPFLWSNIAQIWSYFVLQPPKYGFYTVRLEPVQTHCLSRQAHGPTLGHIFFGFWSPKSNKEWKVLRDCQKKLLTGGPSGNQTFPQSCAPRKSLITLWTCLGQFFPDNRFGLFTFTFHFSYWLQVSAKTIFMFMLVFLTTIHKTHICFLV